MIKPTITFDKIQLFNSDNMEVMKQYPDKYFDIAIVDPPYGINRSKNFGSKEFGWVQHKRSEWDSEIPSNEYFNELFRISKNQIIWGGNYMVEFLKKSMGWIVWDKGQREFSTSDGELAYTSFECKLRIFEMSRAKALSDNGGTTIHSTQKPVALYSWIIKNYVKPNMKILDTHLGSGSQTIAIDKANTIENMNLEFVGIEIDSEYFNDSVQRFKNYKQQKTIFD